MVKQVLWDGKTPGQVLKFITEGKAVDYAELDTRNKELDYGPPWDVILAAHKLLTE
jgi:hypothetical protein